MYICVCVCVCVLPDRLMLIVSIIIERKLHGGYTGNLTDQQPYLSVIQTIVTYQ